MHSDADPEPTLDLTFSSECALDDAAEPDAEAWIVDGLDDLDDGPTWDRLDIPEADADGGLPTHAWNLRRAVAVAATCVPLLLSADPVLGAPPPTSAPDGNLAAPAIAPPASAASAWDGLVDHRVVLTLKDGRTFRGTVLSVHEGKLVCARAGDGLVVQVSVNLIVSAQVVGLPGVSTPHQQTGQGLIVFGSIATAIGGALAIGTLVVAGGCGNRSYSPFCPYYTLPLGVASVVNLAVGIPFLVAGTRKRKQHRKAMEDQTAPTVSAFVAPSREGVMAGVGLRF